MDNERFKFLGNSDSLWKLFEKTGDVTYYLLYKKITENDY